MTTFSPQQEEAMKAVRKWMADKNAPQVFRLFGYAGTGKTTLAKTIRQEVKGRVQYGAFTGKAALVMQTKGCINARTIHSLIYKIVDDQAPEPEWELNPESEVRGARLVIIDECSMVDEALGTDLLSFGTKVLVLGDPAQLPPVGGAGFFTAQEPDYLLTEVHRQAKDNPIIRLSMMIRAGKDLPRGDYGSVQIFDRWKVDQDFINERMRTANQVLVGMNKTRHTYNTNMRQLKEIENPNPILGERLVCLKNNRKKGLLNGGIWTVIDTGNVTQKSVTLSVVPQDAGVVKQECKVYVHPFFFLGREQEIEKNHRRHYDEFDFGYALTVHKSQGSQWDDVLLVDESKVFREDARRHLYTGLTRAAEKITVLI
jgi:exodeoxyribonuclease-5